MTISITFVVNYISREPVKPNNNASRVSQDCHSIVFSFWRSSTSVMSVSLNFLIAQSVCPSFWIRLELHGELSWEPFAFHFAISFSWGLGFLLTCGPSLFYVPQRCPQPFLYPQYQSHHTPRGELANLSHGQSCMWHWLEGTEQPFIAWTENNLSGPAVQLIVCLYMTLLVLWFYSGYMQLDYPANPESATLSLP